MATKNVIDEYFIKVTADANAVNKDMTAALNKTFEKVKSMNKRLESLEKQIKGKIIKDKVDADKEYNIVQNNLRKNNLKQEEASLKREVDLAKINNNKKTSLNSARIKQAVKEQFSANNETLSDMRKFYQQQERMAKKSYERIADIQQTDYFKRLQEADPVRSRQLRGDLRDAANRATLTGDASGIKNLATEMRRSTRSMQRNLNALAFTQNSVTDSTRNMIRSYISLFALFEGTRAIKNVGQDFQGIEASMLAAAGSSQSAAKDMMFINGIVDQMGLNLKSTTDAWVKFKFAAKGKITQGQQEDIFTGLSMFGTALKVDDESMKRSQKAIIQIDNYCLAA